MVRVAMSEEPGIQGGFLACRLLVDALAFKCGYREVEWKEAEREAGIKRKEEACGTRLQAALSKKEVLFNEAWLQEK